MIRALIMDFDGTIVDTEAAEVAAWTHVYAGYDVAFPLDQWVANIGRDEVFEPLGYLQRAADRPVDPGQTRQCWQQVLRRELAALPARPGVDDFLQRAVSLGLPLAIASNSSHRWVDPLLARLGLVGIFACICCRDDVNEVGKPDPAVYLAAAACLGAPPAACLAIEDSPNGIQAARAAGMRVVAFPNPLTANLDLSRAERVVVSLSDLPLAAWVA